MSGAKKKRAERMVTVNLIYKKDGEQRGKPGLVLQRLLDAGRLQLAQRITEFDDDLDTDRAPKKCG